MHQDLSILTILRRAVQFNPEREIVSVSFDHTLSRTNYRLLDKRARQMSSALINAGLRRGQVVGTLCRTHLEHVELYYAGPIAGLVTHPVNPRLSIADVAQIIKDAGDQIVFIDYEFVEIWRAIKDQVPVRKWVFIGDHPTECQEYEQFLSTGRTDWNPEPLDEDTTALLTYTSGTTGHPKGVEVSHRAVVLHAMGTALPNWMNLCDRDVVMPVVPMCHALAWGWPYSAALIGAKLVLPGAFLDPASLLDLIQKERVTLTGGVPTVWTRILEVLDEQPNEHDTSSLRMVLSGGATAAPTMIDGLRERHHFPLVHTWGMTELTVGVIANPTWDLELATEDERREHRYTQGIPMPLLEIRGRGEKGFIAWDGTSLGELEIRGPWVAREYWNNQSATSEQWTSDGWFRTGDIVAITPRGAIRIADRAKDVIKSGGEWIVSPRLENVFLTHPAVSEVAVIGIPDPQWTERPLAVVSLHHTADVVNANELIAFVGKKVPKWWLPERVEFVEELPKNAVGKIDKQKLRSTFGGFN